MSYIDSCFVDRKSKTLDIITVIDLIREMYAEYTFHVSAANGPRYLLTFKLLGSNPFRKVVIPTVKFGHVRYDDLVKVLEAIDAPYPDRKVKASPSLNQNSIR